MAQRLTFAEAPAFAGVTSDGHRLLEIGPDRLEELLRRHPALLRTDEDGEVLRHLALLDGLDADPLERLGEAGGFGVVVELAAELEAAGPGEDRGDRVGRGRLALLVHAVVAG